jgi:protein-S-isoprenylcysteine O-methyltransferase Ste14
MSLLRLYLLLGLVAHKVVWEILKQRQGRPAIERHATQSLRVRLIKSIKVGILLSIVIQTLLTIEILPIVSEPFLLRIIGVLVYTVGLLMAIAGRVQLSDNWSDIETAQVLREQDVVAHGIYHYIRHPIYIGDLLLLLGLELSLNSWLIMAVGMLIPVVLRQAIREERMLVQTLPGYDIYCNRTKRFIPFVV